VLTRSCFVLAAYAGVAGQFADRRGSAAAGVAVGYGMGAILTIFPIDDLLATSTNHPEAPSR
jgi:hypothetical protein